MSMHSVDELRQRLHAAGERYAAAKKDLHDASEALKSGILRDTGLEGHIVEATHPWRVKTRVRMLVQGVVSEWGKYEFFCGVAIKKNGKPGAVKVQALIEGARDLGAYTQ